MVWVPLALGALLLTGQPAVAPQRPTGSAPPSARQAQPPPLKTSLSALRNMLVRVPSAPASLSFAQFRVKNAVTKLQQLAAHWPAESPVDYRANLAASVTLLDRAIAEPSVDHLTAVLEALGDDLEVKLEHCTKSGGKLGGSVIVSVRTVEGDHESRNWQVFYLPKVFEAMGGVTPDRFPKLSSPTSETLVPGRYVMWVRDANNRTSERISVKVGEGKKELPLDLTVPAGPAR
jgi:hypothetical protein